MNIVPECIRVRTDLYRLSVATKMSSGAARANPNTTPALGATEPQHPQPAPLGDYGIDNAAPLELTWGAVIVDHG